MIWTRTPLRVTLGGGGTDLKSYYSRDGGFIFAMALDKYIYVGAHRPAFSTEVIIHGLEPEVAGSAREVRHDLVRAAMLSHGLEDRLEMTSIGDIDGDTGMGSSSGFLVGFLSALYALKGVEPDRQALAEEACALEIDVLGRGIGKQDQYMSAFGGLTTLDIAPDGRVAVGSVNIPPDVEAAFIAHTHIYFTGRRRDAAMVLTDQNRAMLEPSDRRHTEVSDSLLEIRTLGRDILRVWQNGDLERWGQLLHAHWLSKKRLSPKISWPEIDNLYDHVRANFGVTGGKVIGAGGGGFLMLFTPGTGEALEAYMASRNMPRLRYAIDRAGSTLLTGQQA